MDDDDAGYLDLDLNLRTDGGGLWTEYAGPVRVVRVEWQKSWPGRHPTEWMIRLHTEGWDQMERGLVYTDERFKQEARTALSHLSDMGALPPLPWHLLEYTEQGMQGGHMIMCHDDCEDPDHEPYVHMIIEKW